MFFSIIAGLTSISNASDIGRIGGKLVGTYMCTTVIATILSITIGLFMFHGGVPQMGTISGSGGGVSVSLLDMIVKVVPENLIAPIVNRDMLQVISLRKPPTRSACGSSPCWRSLSPSLRSFP